MNIIFNDGLSYKIKSANEVLSISVKTNENNEQVECYLKRVEIFLSDSDLDLYEVGKNINDSYNDSFVINIEGSTNKEYHGLKLENIIKIYENDIERLLMVFEGYYDK